MGYLSIINLQHLQVGFPIFPMPTNLAFACYSATCKSGGHLPYNI